MAQSNLEIRQRLDFYSNIALGSMASGRNLPKKPTRKPELIDVLARAIADKSNTRAAFEQLDPNAKMLLRLLREQGGKCTIGALKVAGNAVGIVEFDAHFDALLRCALVLYTAPTRVKHELWQASVPGYNSWQADLDWSIEAIPLALELADDSIELPAPTQTLEAYDAEPFSMEEQSGATLLHVVWSVVRWATDRELTLTKTTGMLRKADLKVLDNQLKESADLKGFALALSLEIGLMHNRRGTIVPDKRAPEFFARAPREQIQKLFEAWQQLENWSEFFRIPEIECESQTVPRPTPRGWGYDSNDIPTTQALPAARAYLIGILKRAGGETVGQWQSLASLRALVVTQNPEFLIPAPKRRSYSTYVSERDAYDGFWPRGEGRWSSAFERVVDWDKVEGRFLRQMLCEPLHWMGLVAIARDKNNEVVAFRLTPSGAHLLGLSDEMPADADQSAAEKPLIVQPNFEIMAYTAAGNLPVLYQLERFATRERAERVAHYKLDRDSVYRGLQDGLSATEMREFLETHSRSGVPQNIAYSLNDWEMLWQSITIQPSSTVVEADTSDEMDALVASLPADATTRMAPQWAVIEPRYLEAARTYLASKAARAFDYSIETEQAFSTDDDLEISVPLANLDLWLRAKLLQFADELPATKTRARFQITPSSVARATKLGLKSGEILGFLAQTGTPPVAANVTLTINGWGGDVKPVALGSMQMLVAAPEVIAQIASIEELKPLLWLGLEGAILVKTADVSLLKAQLKKRGIAFDGNAETHLKAPKPLAPAATPTRLKPAQRSIEIGNARRAKKTIVPAHPDEHDIKLQSGLDAEAIEALLEGALDKSRCVVIEYQSKARIALRKISPLELFGEGEARYLGAWDYWRKAGRVFRVDRIRRIAVTDEKFDPSQFE